MSKWINDAGHGGNDNGMSAFGMVEKAWALEAALYVDKRLGEHGIDSVVTRDKDITLSSGPRTARVRNSGAEKCLSHHYNAAGGAGQGCEFIHSLYSDGEFEEILKEKFEEAGMNCRRIFERKNSRGTDYYYMHRDTGQVRTTIVEYGFPDNPKDYQFLRHKENRERLYEAVVESVCEEERVVYKGKKDVHVQSKQEEQAGKFVEVNEGDTLWGLGEKYDVSVDELKEWNNLDGDLINVGDELKVGKALDLNIPNYNFSRGSKGKNVKLLQEDLEVLGFYNGALDGSFGPKTEQAVKDFQTDAEIEVDGSYGPETRKAMKRYE